MALTGIHTNWLNDSYACDIIKTLKINENDKLMLGNLIYLRPYYDGSIAIGYGFDLLKNSDAKINEYLTLANFKTTTLTPKDTSLLKNARSQVKAKTATEAYLRNVASQLSISLVDEPSAEVLLQLKLNDYEDALDVALGGHSQLADSNERIAIISLLYTMVDPNSTKISNKIPSTIAAIKNNNRAEAWYEIRYRSNGDGDHTERRYKEADLFGLYDDGVLSTDQTKEIMRMYTRYEYEGLGSIKLSAYELPSKCPPPSGIQNINDSIKAASDYLFLNFAKGKTIDGWVIVGRGLDSYNYLEKNWADIIIGTNKNDLIFGEKGSDIIDGSTGDDVIYGGEGDDKITGGKNDDILIGGTGNDTYYYTSGDGHDTIIDSGMNRIIYKDADGSVHPVQKFYKTGVDVYTDGRGKVILTHHSPWQITTDDGGTITLGDNAQPDDFGIKLLDVPDAPQTTNNITEPTNPSEPNKFDDTAANDKIITTDGDDRIYSWNGGDDWIIAGDGRDIVESERITWTTLGDGEIYVNIPAPGNDIIEGGSGADLIDGGEGNDKIFADNYGDMNTLISEGGEAQSINEQGDLITGNRGNDFIFGSNLNDALFGGPDDDLISGEKIKLRRAA